MYRVTVTINLVKEKEILRLLIPTFVWMLLFFVLFAVMCRTDIWFMVIPVGIEFLSIIPIFIVSYKKSRKLYQESIVQTELMLMAKDRAIYKDEIKLNAEYNVVENEVYLNYERDLGKNNHHYITSYGIISGDDVAGFVTFCRENGIEIEVFNVKS